MLGQDNRFSDQCILIFLKLSTRVLNVWGGYLFCFFELHSARLPVVADCSGGSLNVSTQMQRRSRKWSRRSVSWRRSLRTPRSAIYRSVRSPLLVSESACQRQKPPRRATFVFTFVRFILSFQKPRTLHFYFILLINCLAWQGPFQKWEKSFTSKSFPLFRNGPLWCQSVCLCPLQITYSTALLWL